MIVGCSETTSDSTSESVADEETTLELADGAVTPDASMPLYDETGADHTTNDEGLLHEGVPSEGVELDDEPLVFVRGARFSDIDGSFAQAMITFLSGTGVIAGYSDGTYRPSRLVTLAALLAAAFPSCSTTRGARSFRDLPPDHWAHAAVDRVQRCAIMSGYPDGTFGPPRSTTRLGALVAIHGALRNTSDQVDRSAGTIEGWSVEARAAAVREHYFDATRIPSWSHAALVSATQAGMVILGVDRVGVEVGTRRVLLHDDAATRRCRRAPLRRHQPSAQIRLRRQPSPRTRRRVPSDALSRRRASRRGVGFHLRRWSAAFERAGRARALRSRDVTGLFFTVSHSVGWVDAVGAEGPLPPRDVSFSRGLAALGP